MPTLGSHKRIIIRLSHMDHKEKRFDITGQGHLWVRNLRIITIFDVSGGPPTNIHQVKVQLIYPRLFIPLSTSLLFYSDGSGRGGVSSALSLGIQKGFTHAKNCHTHRLAMLRMHNILASTVKIFIKKTIGKIDFFS